MWQEHGFWIFVLCFTFGALWHVMFTLRIWPWLVRLLFHAPFSYGYKSNGKKKLFHIGIIQLTEDDSFLLWKTGLATVLYWSISVAMLLLFFIFVATDLAFWFIGTF
ncbi:MAG TPA: hypothetical protein VHO69_07055 [Phototrophicaceae bacterium]|nr:hypothetical protein [Phototrophicaceae bacterium]